MTDVFTAALRNYERGGPTKLHPQVQSLNLNIGGVTQAVEREHNQLNDRTGQPFRRLSFREL